MNSEQAKAVAQDMERHGWNTLIRLTGSHWTVRAIEADTGYEVTIKTPAEWESHKAETVQAQAQSVAAGSYVQESLL